MAATDPFRDWYKADVERRVAAQLPISTASFFDARPPGVKVHYFPDGGPLCVGIYPDADHGILYRWDNGPDEPPTVIPWRSARSLLLERTGEVA